MSNGRQLGREKRPARAFRVVALLGLVRVGDEPVPTFFQLEVRLFVLV